MACVVVGRLTWGGGTEPDGHRNYFVRWLVRGDYTDGPAQAMQAVGLVLPGVAWSFGPEADSVAYCLPTKKFGMHKEKEGEVHRWFTIEQNFSTKPAGSCADQSIDDPLLMPIKVSGGFTKDKEEAVRDRFGERIVNSAFEQMRGPQNEWPANKSTLKFEMNVATLDLGALTKMVNTVNDATIWGFPPRTVLMLPFTWEEKYYGQCFKYFTLVLEFELIWELYEDDDGYLQYKTWDRDLLDEGTKCLRGHWDTSRASLTFGQYIVDDDPDDPGVKLSPDNPANFVKFKDFKGENAKVILDGHGRPWNPEQLRWWAIGVLDIDGNVTGVTAYGPHTYAEANAEAAGNPLWGPFDEEAEANIADTNGPDISDDPFAAGKVHVEKFKESNFLVLGLPTTIGS